SMEDAIVSLSNNRVTAGYTVLHAGPSGRTSGSPESDGYEAAQRSANPAMVSTRNRPAGTLCCASRFFRARTPACVCVRINWRVLASSATASAISSVFPQPAGATTRPLELLAKSGAIRSGIAPGFDQSQLIFQVRSVE